MELLRRKIVQEARTDPNVFAEYVFEMKQSWFHRELQQKMLEHPRLTIDAPVESGKTTQVMARILHHIGQNPTCMGVLVGNAPRRPREILMTIRNTIQHNKRFKEVFPDIKLTKATRDELVVRREMTSDAGPTLLATGIMGSIIGSRFTFVVTDDIVDFMNSYSALEKRKLQTVLESTLLNRLTQNGWHVDIGTPWSWDDARHWLRTLDGYRYFHYSAEQMLWPEAWEHPKTGTVWGWPKERLEQKKRMLSRLEWSRQFLCKPISALTQTFNPDDVEKCLVPDLGLLGRHCEKGVVVTGVDLATKKDSFADRTVLFTVACYEGLKEVLDIRSGHWELPDILRQMLDVTRRYGNHRLFYVESNQGQAYVHQATRQPEMMKALGATEADLSRLVVKPVYTTKKKLDDKTGIRSMAIDFEQHRWKIPCDSNKRCEPEVDQWLRELINFDPVSHPGDRVVASWLACEAGRRYFGGSSRWSKYGIG